MLHIGNTYMQRMDGQTRLCADISIDGRGTTLWFGVNEAQEACLCPNRSDPFLMALLPTAMRGGHDIQYETAASARLCYQLENYLIPAVSSVGSLYHPIHIHGPLTAQRIINQGGVATGFSGGVDSLYSILTHGPDSEYPLTHLAVFNSGVFEGAGFRASFRRALSNAERFAAENGLSAIGVDSNVSEVLPERFLDVYSYRNLACALALQGLLSVYLLSSGHDAANFSFDLHNSATYDLLTNHCAKTETMTVYLSGMQATRCDKLKALSQWSPSYRWLHPCFSSLSGMQNCGHCIKCIMTLVPLYALDALDQYRAVFDIPAFKRSLPQRIGFALANRSNHLLGEGVSLLEKSGKPIPPAAYVCEKQFRAAMNHLAQRGDKG